MFRTKDLRFTGLIGWIPVGADPQTVKIARARTASHSICTYLFLWFVLANLRVTRRFLSFTGGGGKKDPTVKYTVS